jgi:minor histocompatibility antigen H13
VNVVLYAAVNVYAGSWRSVQEEPPEDTMTTHEAAKFPIVSGVLSAGVLLLLLLGWAGWWDVEARQPRVLTPGPTSTQTAPNQPPHTHSQTQHTTQVGSCVLLTLFLAFKFLPTWLVNVVLSGYITLIGSLAVHHVAAPVANALCPRRLRERVVVLPTIPTIPWVLDEPATLEYTLPELLLWVPSVGVGVWYSLTKNWMANNYLGLSFALVGIENVALGSVQTAVILLCGLFVYDIFWVFCTPVMVRSVARRVWGEQPADGGDWPQRCARSAATQHVHACRIAALPQVSVAKNFEAPIKLLFPREAMVHWGALLGLGGKGGAAAATAAAAGAKRNFAMLGLGDIVIPGFWVALLLRYDVTTNFKTSYFQTVFWAYVAGLGTTIGVMNYFKAAQPALLYIVPAILLAVLGHAALRGEVAKLWRWHEDDALTDAQKAKKAARKAAAEQGGGKKEQ